jgi:hypothetical protein
MESHGDENNPLRAVTIPGRLLVILTLALTGGGFAAVVLWLEPELAPGRYPIIYFLIPVLLGASVFFACGRLLMGLIGIPFWRKDAERDV